MKNFNLTFLTLFFSCLSSFLQANNQTNTIDTPIPETTLPFRIRIAQANFSFPVVSNQDGTTSSGIQAFGYGAYKNKRIFLAGRTAGVHWLNNTNSFLPSQQNTYIYVLNLDTNTISYRSLEDPSSLLSQNDIDILSVVAPQSVQLGDFLYLVGGYGYNHTISNFETSNVATVIDLPKAINWVANGEDSFLSCITYIEDPYLQVTGGGALNANRHKPILLCLGQNFEGSYTLSSNGQYTNQIRGFYFLNSSTDSIIKATQYPQDENYRRRDLNTVPIIKKENNTYVPALVCFSGVFTPDTGVWTVPIIVDEEGDSYMQNPDDPDTIKQGMNAYHCAHASLFSIKDNKSFVLFFGGITFQYYENGLYITDTLIPFTNNVTTITIDKNMKMQQYLMSAEFPTINYPNSSAPSYFGTHGKFIPMYNEQFLNEVIAFDKLFIGKEVLIGYIVGGIQSSGRNTGGVPGTSIPSSYIFEVYLTKN